MSKDQEILDINSSGKWKKYRNKILKTPFKPSRSISFDDQSVKKMEDVARIWDCYWEIGRKEATRNI